MHRINKDQPASAIDAASLVRISPLTVMSST